MYDTAPFRDTAKPLSVAGFAGAMVFSLGLWVVIALPFV